MAYAPRFLLPSLRPMSVQQIIKFELQPECGAMARCLSQAFRYLESKAALVAKEVIKLPSTNSEAFSEFALVLTSKLFV